MSEPLQLLFDDDEWRKAETLLHVVFDKNEAIKPIVLKAMRNTRPLFTFKFSRPAVLRISPKMQKIMKAAEENDVETLDAMGVVRED